jgi:hypothetical protein
MFFYLKISIITMKGYVVDEFYSNIINSKVYYESLDYKITKIDILQEKFIYCQKAEQYIKYFVDNIKENVIRKFNNLNLVEIEIRVFNKNKILHRFIVTISNMIRDILNQKEKINLYHTLCIIIKYNNKTAFTGNINFTGLC